MRSHNLKWEQLVRVRSACAGHIGPGLASLGHSPTPPPFVVGTVKWRRDPRLPLRTRVPARGSLPPGRVPGLPRAACALGRWWPDAPFFRG
eukprot:189697-Chlamydomonas_euryale.AAC.2